MRVFLLAFLAISAVATAADPIIMSAKEREAMPRWGAVRLSGPNAVTLTIPNSLEGDTQRGLIELINDSDQPLVVEKIATSCGCTAARPLAKDIPPGKKTSALVHYRPKSAGVQSVDIQLTLSKRKFLASGRAITTAWFEPKSHTVDILPSGQTTVSIVATKGT